MWFLMIGVSKSEEETEARVWGIHSESESVSINRRATPEPLIQRHDGVKEPENEKMEESAEAWYRYTQLTAGYAERRSTMLILEINI